MSKKISKIKVVWFIVGIIGLLVIGGIIGAKVFSKDSSKFIRTDIFEVLIEEGRNCGQLDISGNVCYQSFRERHPLIILADCDIEKIETNAISGVYVDLLATCNCKY